MLRVLCKTVQGRSPRLRHSSSLSSQTLPSTRQACGWAAAAAAHNRRSTCQRKTNRCPAAANMQHCCITAAVTGAGACPTHNGKAISCCLRGQLQGSTRHSATRVIHAKSLLAKLQGLPVVQQRRRAKALQAPAATLTSQQATQRPGGASQLACFLSAALGPHVLTKTRLAQLSRAGLHAYRTLALC